VDTFLAVAVLPLVPYDKARAEASVGAAAGVLEQEQDAGVDAGLGRVEPGDGITATLLTEPTHKLGQRCDVRLLQERALPLDLAPARCARGAAVGPAGAPAAAAAWRAAGGVALITRHGAWSRARSSLQPLQSSAVPSSDSGRSAVTAFAAMTWGRASRKAVTATAASSMWVAALARSVTNAS